ncbi:efflux RND transporter periplasmic adaptor subunit [Azospirillum sp. TSH100]|uniref:efflux RND transporter periplasmic adaptor subunit n=1 Tax=Azospirillum sp. TSH100 TaxID=652764 RepID=UPI0018EE5486|nr:efflux RND transporter periplasmic adaptor subunit [Azospirillum sp. TSH100]
MGLAFGALLVVGLPAVLWQTLHGRSGTPAAAGLGRQPATIPVTVAAASRQDVPRILQGIGTAQAVNTVTIRTRVDGALQAILFTEGQEVKAGDPLARIDPRPYQAALDQATAKKRQDEAQLANARHDLARYENLAQRDFGSHQQADTQKAQVDQLQAQVDGDQAAIDNARLQLDYTTIRSPVDGRIGFRQVDIGNILHASETTGIAVVTQTRPISVIFSLPEDRLHSVVQAMAAGPLPVAIDSRDGRNHLGDGVLKLIDNQVDQTTGTIRLKAEFPNADDRLWPGEFVTARLTLGTDRQVLTVPPGAVQRGADGLHVYVAKPDNTVELRTVKAARLDTAPVVISDGLRDGERVVVSGQLKLQPGSRIDPRQAGNGTDGGTDGTAVPVADGAP